MIQAKDLKQGNKINYNGEVVTVIGTHKNKIFFDNDYFDSNILEYEPFKGIPITEEILKNNFGFKKIYKIGNKKYFEHQEYRISFTVVDNCFVFDFGPATIGQRKYVHEVQNLFKELTQKEIEINL